MEEDRSLEQWCLACHSWWESHFPCSTTEPAPADVAKHSEVSLVNRCMVRGEDNRKFDVQTDVDDMQDTVACQPCSV